MSSQESFDRLHERALAILGGFASLQSLMDHMVDSYLGAVMPDLGSKVVAIGLRRRSDSDRLALTRALAKEVGYSQLDDMDSFSIAFNRCKQMRDLLGHSVNVVGPVYGADVPPHVGIARLRGTKTNLLPTVLLPSHFDRFAAQIDWLSAHTIRLGHESRPGSVMDFQGKAIEPEVPGPLPHADI